MTDTAITETPPQPRWNEAGLLEGTAYHYRADGFVDWRRSIPREYLYIARESEETMVKRFGKPVDEIDITQVEDRYLRVYLGGWKHLLKTRGYLSLDNPCTFVTPEKAVATCTIVFRPSFETGGNAISYSWTASASLFNTSGDISQAFLESTACNRAFSLCLRGFLNIGIVGHDEIGPVGGRRGAAGSDVVSVPSTSVSTEPTAQAFSPQLRLQETCREMGITLDKLKAAAANYATELKSKPETWTQFSDVPGPDVWTLVGKMKAKQEEAKDKVTKTKIKG